MRAYLKLKKIDVPIEDHTIFKDHLPQKGKDYTLFVDVALTSFEKTQVEADDEDEEVYYYMELTGPVSLIPADVRRGAVQTAIDAQPEVPQPEPLADTVQSS